MPFNCELVLKLLEAEGWRGVRYGDDSEAKGVSKTFDTSVKQEEIVNKGIKDLLFSRFLPDLPAQNTA